ncbi:MAG: DUF2138 family protein [Candidatus Accumulibacter sp.]|nr:DUF2138 family protein [Accumulibacter sp.]
MAAALALVLALSAAIGAAYFAAARRPPFKGGVNALDFELSRPDALIRSSGLSRLPPDLLRLPLAKDVLTEDFVDYYEHNENREALLGVLKRIAYEHRLDLPEQVLEEVFDAPAEVALWRDEGGRLRHFALAMKLNVLARVVRLLLPLSDAQLFSAGTLRGAPVLVLDYGNRHRLALIAKGDRVVALSDPGMLLKSRDAVQDGEKGSDAPGQSENAVEVIAELLDAAAPVSPFARHFQLDAALPAQTHEITLGLPVFAFAYAQFMPGLKGARLAFDGAGRWQSSALLDSATAKQWDASALWRAMPHGAAFCAAVPVAWQGPMDNFAAWREEVNGETLPDEEKKALGARFEPLAAACWYEGLRFYTPLFAAQFKTPLQKDEARAWLKWTARMTRFGSNAESEIRDGTGAGFWAWEGGAGAALAIQAFTLGAGKGEGTRRDFFFFSPDAKLVSKARDVAAKKYPALADDAQGADTLLAAIDPKALAALAQAEVFAALPRNEEADFRNAAEVYLIPRLEALAKYPAQRVRLQLPALSWRDAQWCPLEWSGQ